MRIVLRNETRRALDIHDPFWIANGSVALELPPKLALQVESMKGGWDKEQWLSEGLSAIHVAPGQAFRTWIGLHEHLNDIQFSRAVQNRSFGTLSFKLNGQTNDFRVPV